MTTVRELLAEGARAGMPGLEVRLLASRALGVGRTWLIAHDTEAVEVGALTRAREWFARRAAGEPVAYLLGEREFMGHVFRVGPAVLIPRPETELLVETGLEHVRDIAAPRLLDLGTGSGAIAISLALARPDAEVTATDLSTDALAVAGDNARRLGARLGLHAGSWWDALPAGDTGGFDLVVSNPPYIRPDDEHLARGDLRHEPLGALTDHIDGLAALRAIAAGAPARLNPGGALWVEHGYDQAAAVRELLVQAGFADVRSLRDLAGIERVSGGVRLL
ncbi:peptide chain release factor N(5)-glutamine methyltransferase [Verticiella sediminum]|uniref:Release factor glutamine methyltransferase n=1 Tax=Verticiella sediminum TaxID=1247510 RepID=A0A556AG87_9BURK|nr:peptide chain release factor N(5)-glutamine methyltransferase [Verticiella sediminum]TSH91891.1 peptide chain release factor N(5)-glutamine methyltransferase [Verticiella sediminum]